MTVGATYNSRVRFIRAEMWSIGARRKTEFECNALGSTCRLSTVVCPRAIPTRVASRPMRKFYFEQKQKIYKTATFSY